MLDARGWISFVEPVWHLELIRDSETVPRAVVLERLRYAAAMNVTATMVLFPKLAGGRNS
jgi:hypothetical protein